jgi:hypothetical protein
MYDSIAEHSLEFYVKKYIQKRLKTLHMTDLESSLFYNDIFVRNNYYKRKDDYFGHFFRTRRVRPLLDRHESYLLMWLLFVEKN